MIVDVFFNHKKNTKMSIWDVFIRLVIGANFSNAVLQEFAVV